MTAEVIPRVAFNSLSRVQRAMLLLLEEEGQIRIEPEESRAEATRRETDHTASQIRGAERR